MCCAALNCSSAWGVSWARRVELAQQQPALDVVALQPHDLGVFADGQLQHLLRRAAILNIAQRLQIDAAQQLVSVQSCSGSVLRMSCAARTASRTRPVRR